MKVWLIFSNILVAIAGLSYVYAQMNISNQLDIAAVALLIIGVINVVLSIRLK